MTSAGRYNHAVKEQAVAGGTVILPMAACGGQQASQPQDRRSPSGRSGLGRSQPAQPRGRRVFNSTDQTKPFGAIETGAVLPPPLNVTDPGSKARQLNRKGNGEIAQADGVCFSYVPQAGFLGSMIKPGKPLSA